MTITTPSSIGASNTSGRAEIRSFITGMQREGKPLCELGLPVWDFLVRKCLRNITVVSDHVSPLLLTQNVSLLTRLVTTRVWGFLTPSDSAVAAGCSTRNSVLTLSTRRSHRLRAQPHETAPPPPLQMPITGVGPAFPTTSA